MKIKALLVFAVIGLLAGCAFVSKALAPTGQEGAALIVDVATTAAIGRDAAKAPGRAAVIQNIAQSLLAVDTGDSVTVAALQAALAAKVQGLHLAPGDQLLAEDLGNAFIAAINQYVGAKVGGISPTVQVAVAFVLNRIILVTKGYTGGLGGVAVST